MIFLGFMFKWPEKKIQENGHDKSLVLWFLEIDINFVILCNRIEPKMENTLMKNQNGFRRNRSMTSQILTICRILEGVPAKNLQAILIFVDFTIPFTEER